MCGDGQCARIRIPNNLITKFRPMNHFKDVTIPDFPIHIIWHSLFDCVNFIVFNEMCGGVYTAGCIRGEHSRIPEPICASVGNKPKSRNISFSINPNGQIGRWCPSGVFKFNPKVIVRRVILTVFKNRLSDSNPCSLILNSVYLRFDQLIRSNIDGFLPHKFANRGQ